MIVFIMNMSDRYRLLALAELGARFPDTIPASEVARRRAIPPAYLAQLVRELARSAIVRTRRGPGGGLRLARPPQEIPLDEVLVADPGARAQSVIEARLRTVLADALDGVSVADLVVWEREAAPASDYTI